jgi:hypothetical protein
MDVASEVDGGASAEDLLTALRAARSAARKRKKERRRFKALEVAKKVKEGEEVAQESRVQAKKGDDKPNKCEDRAKSQHFSKDGVDEAKDDQNKAKEGEDKNAHATMIHRIQQDLKHQNEAFAAEAAAHNAEFDRRMQALKSMDSNRSRHSLGGFS